MSIKTVEQSHTWMQYSRAHLQVKGTTKMSTAATIAVNPELGLVTGLYRTTNAVVRELDQRLERDHQVTFIQAVTLLAVDSFEKPQPHLVAAYLSQQSQTVTGVLDRLERAGFLTRKRDLDDRRAVRLELTNRGATLVLDIRKSLEEHVKDVLAGVNGGTRGRMGGDLEALELSVKGSAHH